MFIFGGWNGHDTMNDIFQYSFLSNYWYEIHRTNGSPPQPRYRHSAVICGSNIYIFGGVDTNQQRFNDIHQFDIEQRRFTKIDTTGDSPQPRTFHRAIIFKNIMYIIGGFDGQRLNDMHHVALLWSNNDDKQSFSSLARRRASSRPFSSTSGFMQNNAMIFGGEATGIISSAPSSADSSDQSQINDKEHGADTSAAAAAMSHT